MIYQSVDTPLGEFVVAGDGTCLKWGAFRRRSRAGRLPRDWTLDRKDPVLRETTRQLERYFAKKLTRFDLPLDPDGTAFQQRVWKKLCAIPFGTKKTYGDIARALRKPAAFRAVGAANGQNPISIIVPCHRLVGHSGGLTGYGGGLDRKRALLVHEGALPS